MKIKNIFFKISMLSLVAFISTVNLFAPPHRAGAGNQSFSGGGGSRGFSGGSSGRSISTMPNTSSRLSSVGRGTTARTSSFTAEPRRTVTTPTGQRSGVSSLKKTPTTSKLTPTGKTGTGTLKPGKTPGFTPDSKTSGFKPGEKTPGVSPAWQGGKNWQNTHWNQWGNDWWRHSNSWFFSSGLFLGLGFGYPWAWWWEPNYYPSYWNRTIIYGNDCGDCIEIVDQLKADFESLRNENDILRDKLSECMKNQEA